MSGTLLAMPMLVINMGGEMVYILEQRLRAQNIPKDKSSKGATRHVCSHYLFFARQPDMETFISLLQFSVMLSRPCTAACSSGSCSSHKRCTAATQLARSLTVLRIRRSCD